MANIEQTLEQRVRARLKELKKRPIDLGRHLGYAVPYDGFYKLFVSGERGLTQELKAKAAEFLDWPIDALSDEDSVQVRDDRVREEFDAFLREGGSEFDRDVIRTLESMRFYGKKVPNRRGFQILAVTLLTVLGGAPLTELVQDLALQSKLAEEPTPPRPRKRR